MSSINAELWLAALKCCVDIEIATLFFDTWKEKEKKESKQQNIVNKLVNNNGQHDTFYAPDETNHDRSFHQHNWRLWIMIHIIFFVKCYLRDCVCIYMSINILIRDFFLKRRK